MSYLETRDSAIRQAILKGIRPKLVCSHFGISKSRLYQILANGRERKRNKPKR